MTNVDILVDAHATLGEGPLWDTRVNAVLWVDILADAVHRYDLASGQDTPFFVPGQPSAIVPRASGGWVLATREGFATLDALDLAPQVVAPVTKDQPDHRMNDGKVDPAGRFWAGTMPYAEDQPTGVLYRLDPDYSVHRMLDHVTVSNGLGWSPDGSRMYYIDSPTRRVDVFDFDMETGSISNRRPLVETAPNPGVPDGMTVDADGALWVAFWGGWAVHRYTPDGRLDREVSLPVSHVTSCTFGGTDLTTLFITSASQGLAPEERAKEPHAGALFACTPGVAGLPTNTFAG